MRIDLQNAILLVLCLVLLLSVFTLSASAEDIVTFVLTSDSSHPQFLYKAHTAGHTYDFYGYTINSSSPVYVAHCLDTPGELVYLSENVASVQLNSTLGNPSFTLQYEYRGYHYIRWGYLNSNDGTITPSIEIPTYSNISSFVDDIDRLSYTSLTYSLPPGNAMYIRVPQGRSYTLRSRMPESVLGSNHYPGNNQVVTLVQALPSGGTAPSSPLIPWQQDGALSVLGLSRNAIYTGTVASSGYLCIVNPLYYSGTANGPYEFLSNGSIDIVVEDQTGFVVYPLDSSLGFTSGLGINVDTTIIDNPYNGELDPETGEIIWEDSDGGNTAPTTGGGNLVSTSDTIFDFLRNIGDEIATFLKGPIQAIQTVVSAIREFLSSFTQLYTWLPSPVYNLITSALMIALTIGVIKIFV